MLSIALFTLMFFGMPGGFDLFQGFEAAQDGPDVTLTWTLNPDLEAESIVVFRGSEIAEILPGTAATWSTTETNYGRVQYSIAWCFPAFGMTVAFDWETAVLDFGRLRWTPPETACDGYLVFVADVPEIELPGVSYKVEGQDVAEISLRTLIDAGVLAADRDQYISMASYRSAADVVEMSVLTAPIVLEAGTYADAVAPFPPEAPEAANVTH